MLVCFRKWRKGGQKYTINVFNKKQFNTMVPYKIIITIPRKLCKKRRQFSISVVQKTKQERDLERQVFNKNVAQQKYGGLFRSWVFRILYKKV